MSFGITRDLSALEIHQAPKLPTGTSIFVEKMEVAEKTDQIQAKLGTSFGVAYVISGLTPGSTISLRKAVKYPPMKLPDRSVSTGYSRDLATFTARPDGTVSNIQGYSFDEPYELVLGTWIVRIYLGDLLLVEKSFSVVPSRQGTEP